MSASNTTPRTLKPGSSIGAADLMNCTFDTPRELIPGFLCLGLTVLASRPKEGKSWLVLLLCACLAAGTPFLGFPPVQCEVLLLALEDTLDRLLDRLTILPIEKSNGLHIATSSNGLPKSILTEIDGQLALYPGIKLVVIDTLQKIRHRSGDVSYQGDYEDLGALKEFADKKGICVLLVHHVRKAEASNIFDTISGTSGITGVADQSMVLVRRGTDARLYTTGRDCPSAEIELTFKNGVWSELSPDELAKRAQEALPLEIRMVIELMDSRSEWRGTCSELLQAIGDGDGSPLSLSRLLKKHVETFTSHGVGIEFGRTVKGSDIHLTKLE